MNFLSLQPPRSRQSSPVGLGLTAELPAWFGADDLNEISLGGGAVLLGFERHLNVYEETTFCRAVLDKTCESIELKAREISAAPKLNTTT